MKKKLLLSTIFFSLIINTASIFASSITAGGIIFTNTVWNSDTVKVVSNVRVFSGVQLTIAPKTIVIFQGYYGIQIEEGILNANGTINDSITFTANDTLNFFDLSKSQGGWQGITFISQSAGNLNIPASQFSYCKFSFVKYTTAFYMYNGGRGNVITSIYYSNLNIYNCKFNYNNGAALMIEGCANINIKDNLITHNNNYVSFSAVCNSNSSNIDVHNNTISYNISSLTGGGISLLNCTNNKITNNRICNNNALGFGCGGSYGGGGIYIENDQNTYIANNLIANNSTVGSGGGIMCNNASPDIINNTIVNNYANYLGGGVGCSYSNLMLKNNIVYDNAHSEIFQGFSYSNFSKNQVSMINSTSGQITHCDLEGGFSAIKCLVFNGTMMAYTNFTGTYTNNINAIPAFFSTSAGSGISFDGLAPDWRLQLSSPCINTGTLNNLGSLPTQDLWYNPRIVGASIDMGAYEAPSEFNPNGIADFENNSDLSIYPNPASNYFTINYTADYKNATIIVVNTLGQIIENKTFRNSEKMFFNTTDYLPAAYFLNITIDNERMSSKLIKQ